MLNYVKVAALSGLLMVAAASANAATLRLLTYYPVQEELENSTGTLTTPESCPEVIDRLDRTFNDIAQGLNGLRTEFEFFTITDDGFIVFESFVSLPRGNMYHYLECQEDEAL